MIDGKGIIIVNARHGQPITIARPEISIVRASNDAIAWKQPCGQFHDRMFDQPFTIIGHEYTALAPPILMSGPAAVPSVTSCLITWTTNIPAYHRVRYKLGIGGSWVTTGWTLTPSTNASVTLSPLVPENTAYWYDVQSCTVGDGSMAFPFTPGDDSAYFSTLCSGVFTYQNLRCSKGQLGKLTWLQIEWDTTVTMITGQIQGCTTYTGVTGDYAHRYDDYAFRFLDGAYQFNVKNRNKCMIWGPWSYTHYFSCLGGGINFQWD